MLRKTAKALEGGKIVNFIWFGVVFSLLYWVLEAFRDVFVFEKGNIVERVFYPDAMSVWMRLLVVCIIILFSARTQHISTRIKEQAEKGKKNISTLGIIRVGLEFGFLYLLDRP